MIEYSDKIRVWNKKQFIIEIPDEIIKEILGGDNTTHSYSMNCEKNSLTIQKTLGSGGGRDCTVIYGDGKIKFIPGSEFKSRR